MLTKSTMTSLGTKAPDFSLLDVVTGKKISLANFTEKKAFVVMFICAHCPYVKHVEKELAQLGQNYQNKNVGIVAISANDAETHPEDGPEELKQQATDLGFPFPYLYDQSQKVAKAYQAACTPDFFVFNEQRELVYRGQLDGSRPENFSVKTNGVDLRAAIDSVLSDQPISENQKPSMGCNIKWKSGNEPEYFL